MRLADKSGVSMTTRPVCPQMVMPGDRQEMADFQEKSVNNTKMLIELNLPNLKAHLPSKQFLELLYNRSVHGTCRLVEPGRVMSVASKINVGRHL